MTHVISGNRGSGKTTKAAEWVKEHEGAVLVVHSVSEAQRVMRDYGLTNKQVCGYDDVRDGRLRGRDPRPLLVVENLDLLFIRYFGQTPDVLTMPDWPGERLPRRT